MTATITTLRTRQTLATLCEPDVKADASLKRIVAAYEDKFMGEAPGSVSTGYGGAPLANNQPSPTPFVSPYLRQALRSEQEVRAQRGKAHDVFETLLTPWRP